MVRNQVLATDGSLADLRCLGFTRNTLEGNSGVQAAGWHCVSSASPATEVSTEANRMRRGGSTQRKLRSARARPKKTAGSPDTSGPSATRADGLMVLLAPSIQPHSIRWKERAKGRVLEMRFGWHGAHSHRCLSACLLSQDSTGQSNRSDRAAVMRHLSRCVK